MSNLELLELYDNQLQRSNKKSKRRIAEIAKYISFCNQLENGEINSQSLKKWMEIRASNLSEQTRAKLHNRISMFTEWANVIDEKIKLIPKYGRIRVDRRKPVILRPNQVNDISIELASRKSIKNITPKTCSVITKLLFVTGLRISELLSLRLESIDFNDKSIYVPCGKGPKDRIIPISDSTSKAIRQYLEWKQAVRPNSVQLFIFDSEYIKNPYFLFRRQFNEVAESLGYRNHNVEPRKFLRVHDLRHSFAVYSLIQIYKNDVDVNEAIVQLSAILGHSKLAHTYWYIESVPELTYAAFERLDK